MNEKTITRVIDMVEWRDIPGLEGRYQAGSDGQIRSLPRKRVRGGILTPQLNNSGYFRVSITSDVSHKHLYVHHLVAVAFIGERPARMDVNHKNGIKTDNRPTNLEYVTRAENMLHARKMGLYNNFAEGHYNHKLTREAVRQIRSNGGVRRREWAARLHVSVDAIDDVLNGRSWRSMDE